MGEKRLKDDGDFISQLIKLDKNLSLSLSLSASKSSYLGHLRPHMKFLEYSCHGLFWISGTIICIWFSNSAEKEAFFFNLLIALFVDILFVSVLKAAIHRKRPDNNEHDMFFSLSVDKMSCPSGHTSRAVLLTYLFIAASPRLPFLHLLLLIWCVSTCASRVLLGRHHLGDVLIGAVLGYIEYCVVDYIWVEPETAKWYLDIFRDSNSVLDEL